MKKETFTKTSVIKVTIPELTQLLQKGGLLTETQSVKYLKSLVRDMSTIDMVISETVTIDVPDNIPDSILRYSLADMDIDTRTYNLLQGIGVSSIAGILAQGQDLKKMRGLGEKTKTYKNLIECIKDYQKQSGFTEFDLTTLI